VTDPLFLPIWIMLSWLIRQVENGIGNETGEQAEVDALDSETTQVQFEPYLPIEQIIKIGIAAFSILLLGLSISAYRKTALKSIVYAAVAFGLFAVQMFFVYLEDAVEGFDQPFNEIIFLGITLAILVLFFTAIVRRR